MDNSRQLRGALLEEAALFLLQRSGYKTVDSRGNDRTLLETAAGLAVSGRGTYHQIDAIADHLVTHPFTHPQRLLVEAKCLSPTDKVGIETIRNAVGVVKDTSEYWTPGARP